MADAIQIDNVSKHFRLNHARADSLKERVIHFRRSSSIRGWSFG